VPNVVADAVGSTHDPRNIFVRASASQSFAARLVSNVCGAV